MKNGRQRGLNSCSKVHTTHGLLKLHLMVLLIFMALLLHVSPYFTCCNCAFIFCSLITVINSNMIFFFQFIHWWEELAFTSHQLHSCHGQKHSSGHHHQARWITLLTFISEEPNLNVSHTLQYSDGNFKYTNLNWQCLARMRISDFTFIP
jgi:hypothetical protein